MATKHLGVRRQGSQFVQGRLHLLRAAFKQAPTAHAEQGVATEKAIVTEKRNVAGGMPGYFNHAEFELEQWKLHNVTFTEALVLATDTWIARAEHFGTVGARQFADSTDVVGMMVGKKDVAQIQIILLERLDNRFGVTRVNDGTLIPTR